MKAGNWKSCFVSCLPAFLIHNFSVVSGNLVGRRKERSDTERDAPWNGLEPEAPATMWLQLRCGSSYDVAMEWSLSFIKKGSEAGDGESSGEFLEFCGGFVFAVGDGFLDAFEDEFFEEFDIRRVDE